MNIVDKLINNEEYLEEIRRNEIIICYGAGSKGAQTIEILRKNNIFPTAFCDNNEKYEKEEYFFCDIPVMSYRKLKEKYKEYCILITCTLNNAIEIYKMLQIEGEKNRIYFLSNPFKAENKLLTTNEILENRELLQETYNLLEDEDSRQLYIDFLNWKITGDQQKTLREKNNNWLEFFDEELLPVKEYVYVDAGAYTGDTILRFLAFCKGNYQRIYAYEPDETNYQAIEKCVEYGRLEKEKIEIFQQGLWSEKCKKTFYSLGANAYESSNFYRGVENTVGRNVGNQEGKTGNINEIQVDMLDNLGPYVDNLLIKIDTLASEYPILVGAKNLICKCQPTLIFEFGTHSSHIVDVVPMLAKLNPDYKFYLRQKYGFGNSRTILYVV